MNEFFAETISKLRREKRLTQEQLASLLGVTFQAVSKWETGQSYPDVELLPKLAAALETNVDSLLGYTPLKYKIAEYESKYKEKGYYWGLAPSSLCYEVMKLRPPVKPLRVLDIGCGEGKDAVFFARNGYIVSAFDVTRTGIEKAKALAFSLGVDVNFFVADMTEYRLENEFDIIFSSGVLHYLRRELRESFFDNLKVNTAPGGLHAVNTFVVKPFIPIPAEKGYQRSPFLSGELFTYYTDWVIKHCDELIFDCTSSSLPHKHCMDVLLAEKV